MLKKKYCVQRRRLVSETGKILIFHPVLRGRCKYWNLGICSIRSPWNNTVGGYPGPNKIGSQLNFKTKVGMGMRKKCNLEHGEMISLEMWLQHAVYHILVYLGERLFLRKR